MVWRLRVVAGFAKDQDSVPSNHVKSQSSLTCGPGYPVSSSVLFLQQVQCHT